MYIDKHEDDNVTWPFSSLTLFSVEQTVAAAVVVMMGNRNS